MNDLLSNITSIGNYFLLNCDSLTSIKYIITQKQLIKYKIRYEYKEILQVID